MHSQHSAIFLNVYLLSGLRQDGGWRTSRQKRAVLHVMFNNCDTTEQDVKLRPRCCGSIGNLVHDMNGHESLHPSILFHLSVTWL